MVVQRTNTEANEKMARSASKANADVRRLTDENFKLTQKLGQLQAKLKSSNMNLNDIESVAPTSIFKRISQRQMTRENKTKLMYGQPSDVMPTGFVDSSFKPPDEWAESKRKKMQKTMTEEQLASTKDYMRHMSTQLDAERQKRLEIQQELEKLQ